MKSKKREQPAKPAPVPAWSLQWWHVGAGSLAALLAVMLTYGPALEGPFVFDDQYLAFFSPGFAHAPLWLAVRGVRPFLMFTFWVNSNLAGVEPYPFHLVNVLFHLVNALLLFAIARRLLSWSGVEGRRCEGLAAFAGGVFLLHPVQTEAVSYVASRSENLSALFLFGAIAVFVYRKRVAISWSTALPIFALFGAAASTKEHTVVLPAVLLLIDYFWNPGFSLSGIRRNWRLYGPIAAGGAVAAVFVLDVLRGSTSAGFHIQNLPWYQYFFTQWRAVWVYFRLFVAPIGQNADYAYPIVRSAFDPAALAGLAGLLALVAGAWYFRKRYTLASFGFLSALILFAPTSSVVPILDAVVERRLYLPMFGLVLAVVGLLSLWKIRHTVLRGAAAGALVVLALLCYQRNRVWGSDVALWEDAVSKAPHNSRAHFQLGIAYYQKGRCDVAEREYAAAARLGKTEHRLLVDWSLALDCLNRQEEAIEKLRQAVAAAPNAYVYSQLAMLYGKRGRIAEALAAVEKALELNPRDDMAHFYRGNLRTLSGDAEGAAADYRRALEINPDNEQARRGLARVLARPQPR